VAIARAGDLGLPEQTQSVRERLEHMRAAFRGPFADWPKKDEKRVDTVRFLFAIIRAWLLLEGKKRFSTSWNRS
jgi:hypothetical protein